MPTPSEAMEMGRKSNTGELRLANGDQITAEKCPFNGRRTQFAGEAERAQAYLRDCWFSGFSGDNELPPLIEGDPDPATKPEFYPETGAPAKT